VKLCLQYKEFIANKKKNRTTSFEKEEESNKTLEQEVLTEDLNIDMNQTEETPLPNSEETLTNLEKVRKEKTVIPTMMEEDSEVPNNETLSDVDKENSSIVNAFKTTVVETEEPQALNSPLVLIANEINLQPRCANAEEEFTVVSYKRKKDKKTSTKQK
ncbi:32913_t:CDS:1, partial [Racocetra persica]